MYFEIWLGFFVCFFVGVFWVWFGLFLFGVFHSFRFPFYRIMTTCLGVTKTSSLHKGN